MDKSQDWHLIKFAENATHTLLEFYRHYNSCDPKNDLELFEDEIHVSNIIFSYSFVDPPSIENIVKPEFEKVSHLNFFVSDKEFEPREDDIEEIDCWLNVIEKKF